MIYVEGRGERFLFEEQMVYGEGRWMKLSVFMVKGEGRIFIYRSC